MVVVLVFNFTIFIFAFVFIEESVQQKKSISFILPLKIIYRALKDPRKRLTIIFINVANVLTIFAYVSETNVLRTYQMSPPYCLDSEELGWIAGENRVISLFTMPVLWFWQRLHLSESTIAAIGMAFETASQFLMATVRLKWVFFAAPFISIPGKLAGVMVKTITFSDDWSKSFGFYIRPDNVIHGDIFRHWKCDDQLRVPVHSVHRAHSLSLPRWLLLHCCRHLLHSGDNPPMATSDCTDC
ncbi:uncharacterized protein LOC112568239 [Pomacea canaliculata]|uniref:uncharacterized protein LOC112568239 n=1 Tax=Pomacea canaliculata TaxID=400727 RepID=UPI000D735556|nr:uncharacterized protein LOC112568239 [Pomacea canaliculata]